MDTLAQAYQYTLSELEALVTMDAKQRFEFSEDRLSIRACQGHSIPIDLGLKEVAPPETLYHGTAERFVAAIMKDGLKPMSRNFVQLTTMHDIAVNVGQRHGNPVVLVVTAQTMHQNGHQFFQASNGVWLTKYVSPEYISIPSLSN